jgi:hypothetical protein
MRPIRSNHRAHQVDACVGVSMRRTYNDSLPVSRLV